MRVEEVADELYGIDPDEFTARRNARAAEARRAGEREVAAAVRGLPRPTRSAWLVNLLARRCADELGELLGLGEQLREAQQQLSGDELRRLGANRHRVVYALAQRARELGAEDGHSATEGTVREVQATLEAALADPGAAAAVRSGRLAKPLQAGGFDGVDVQGAVALPDAMPAAADPRRLRPVADRRSRDRDTAARRTEEDAARREREAAARRELDEARQAAAEAREEHDAAQDRLRDLQARADQAAARVDELEQELRRARRAHTDTERALHAQEQAAHEAERADRDAQRRLQRAERSAGR